jgi:hypothetical protein
MSSECLYVGIYIHKPALRPTPPPGQWVPGSLSSRIKRPEHESDRSSLSSAEVKMAELYIHSFICPHGVVLNCIIN